MIQVTPIILLLTLFVIELCVILASLIWHEIFDSDRAFKCNIVAMTALVVTGLVLFAIGFSPLKNIVLFAL